MIPQALQNEQHYCVKIKKGEKFPIGVAWEITPEEWEQQINLNWENKTTRQIKLIKGKPFLGKPSNYKYSQIKDWDASGERTGLLVGPTGVMDFEIEGNKEGKINRHFEELNKICELELPPTLTIKTPSGGKRRIFLCPELKTNIELKHFSCSPKEQEAEFRGNGQSIIAGSGYELIKDIPIAKISLEKLETIFYDYLAHERMKTINLTSNKIEIPIIKVVNPNQYTSRGNGEFQGPHPAAGHPNETGWNFAVSVIKNTWYCHHTGHRAGGGTLDLIAVMEGIIDCSEVKNGLRGEKFLATLEVAKNKYGYIPTVPSEPTPTSIPLGSIKKEQIATAEEYEFKNVLSPNHYCFLFILKVAAISDTYPEYSFANALNQLSMVIDREITLQITPKSTQLNLWIILLGQSTISRKTAALDQNKIITNLSGLDYKLGLNDASPEAFIQYLQDRPQQNLIWDEIGGFFSKAKKKYMDEIPSLMCALYDSPETYERKLRKESFHIEKVYLSLIGATTPETFRKTTNEDDFTSGFFYRTMFLFPERKKIRKRIDKLPEEDAQRAIELAEWLATLYKFIKHFKKAGIELQMEFEPEGLDLHDKWCSDYENYFFDSDSGKEMQSFFGRMQINALKMAALLYLGSEEIHALMKSVYTKEGEGDEFTKFTKFTDSLSSLQLMDNSSVGKLVNLVNKGKTVKMGKILIPTRFVKIAIYYASRLFLPYNAKVLRLVQAASGADLEKVYKLAVEHSKDGCIEHSDLLHRTHIKSKDFKEIVSTLEETGRFFISTNKFGKKTYTPLKKDEDEVKPPEVEL